MRAARRTRIAALGFVAALAIAPAAPLDAQTPANRPATEMSPEQQEALHVGMLELRQLERSGNRSAAIAKGVELLEKFPGNRRIEDALINLYRVERRDEDLTKVLRGRHQRDPGDVETARDLASGLLARKQVNEATQVVQRNLAANPGDENRYRVAAALFASREQNEIAIQIYRQGREAIGNPALYAPEVAQLEVERGDYAGAITEYLLLAADPGRRPRVWREVSSLLARAEDRAVVLDRVEEMRRKHPKSAPIQDIAAMVLLQSGRYTQALTAIREADRLAGDQGEHLLDFGRTAIEGAGPDSLSTERARVGVEALELLARGHPQSNLIPEAVRLASEGLVNLARRLPDSNERRELLAHAVKIIDASGSQQQNQPFAVQTQALKGMILLEDLGKPREALQVFEQVAAVQRQQGEPDQLVRVQIALCKAALGDLDAARVALDAVVREDTTAAAPQPIGRHQRRPKEPEHIGWSRARYYRAEFDLIDGKLEDARTGFAALAEEAPEDRLANDCLDMALVLTESTGESAPVMKQFGAYRKSLLLRDRAAARTALESIVRDAPKSSLAPIALYDLGTTLAAAGDNDAALARWQELLAAHPQHRLAPRALESTGDLQSLVLHRPDLAVASYEKLLMGYPDDLFLDGVRRKLLEARGTAKGGSNATP